MQAKYEEDLRRGLPAKDEELELVPGSTGFRKYPGHTAIKRLSKAVEPPAEPSIGDMLAQLSFTERGADSEEEDEEA